MAKFFHADRVIDYRLHMIPVPQDLVLLQNSTASMTDFWTPVTEGLKSGQGDLGRVLICEWYQAGLDPVKMAKDLCGLCATLGMSSFCVVACGDAAKVVEEIERWQGDFIADKLIFENNISRAADLLQPIRSFLQI
jgi:hypothetical protein